MSVELTVEQEVVRSHIKKWIDDICEKKGYKRTNLARESSLSPSTILKLFNDPDYKFIPTMKTLQSISSATGYPLPDDLLNSKAPFLIHTGAQPGRKSNIERATIHLPKDMEGETDADDVVSQNTALLSAGIRELPARGEDEFEDAAPKGKGMAAEMMQRTRPAREKAVEASAPAPASKAVERVAQHEAGHAAVRMIPFLNASALPAGLQARRGATPVTECPETLIDVPTAFAVRLGDNSMAPILKSGTVVYGSKHRDPEPSDIVYVRKTDGRSFVRSCADMNEHGIVLQNSRGEDMLVGFDDIEDIGIIGIAEMAGFTD